MARPPESNPLAGALGEYLASQGAPKPARTPATPAPAPVLAPPNLLGAYREVLEDEAHKSLGELEPVSLWHRVSRPLVGISAFLVAAWLWFLPPAWLVSAPEPAVLWPAGETGSNLLLINAADAIELFRQTRGRLPQNAEVDSVAPRVAFIPLQDGGFELRSPTGYSLHAPPPWAQATLGYELGDPPGVHP